MSEAWAFSTERQLDDTLRANRRALGRDSSNYRDNIEDPIILFVEITEIVASVKVDDADVATGNKAAKGKEVEFDPKTFTYVEVDGGLIFDSSETAEGNYTTGYVFSRSELTVGDFVEVINYIDEGSNMEWLVREGGSGTITPVVDVPWRGYFGSLNTTTLTRKLAAGNGADGNAKPAVEPELLTTTSGLMIKSDAAFLTKAPSDIKRRDFGDSGEENTEKDSLTKDNTLYYYARVTNNIKPEVDFTIEKETESQTTTGLPEGESLVLIFTVTASEYTSSVKVNNIETDGRKGLEYSVAQVQNGTIDYTAISTYVQYLGKIKSVVDDESFTVDIFSNSTLTQPKIEDAELISTGKPLTLQVDDVVPVVALTDGTFVVSGLIEV
jgi:hypothetical protein